MDGAGISLIIILCLIVIVIICSTIKIVPQAAGRHCPAGGAAHQEPVPAAVCHH